MQSSGWRRLDSSHAIYRYQPRLGAEAADSARMPVLFLHPLPPEAGSPLAEWYRQDGFTAIYAYPVTGTDNAAALKLDEAITWLMTTHHARHSRLILVGCASGGVLGRRYVMLGGQERAAYLFMLGSSHRYSALAYLRGTIFEAGDNADEPPPIITPNLGDTVMVNIYSEGLGAGPNFPEQEVHLTEAVNLSLPLGQEALCRDTLTYQEMRRFLQGQLWLVTVRLQSLEMRGPETETHTGPFCFEINGWRAPFDGVLRMPLGKYYEFNPGHALLGTLPFPLTQMGRAVDINFRLKDLSPPRLPRRKLLASLHTPLRAGAVSEHVLQDSLGSEVRIQVRCDRPEPVLEPDS